MIPSPLCRGHVWYRISILHIFSGTTYRFSAAISTPGSNPQYLLRWLFGDGTMAMGNVVEHTYAIGTPPSTIVTLQAIRNSGGPGQGTVACEGSKPLGEQPTCNKRNKKSANQDFAIGSERWRLDCSIWVDGGVGGWFTQGNVGSRSKSLKRGFAGIWSGRDAEQIWISLEGHYLRKINNSCLIRVVPFLEETEINSGNVQRNISDPFDPYLDPLQLWSTHRMKVSGQIWAYTQNGGKLYLD